MTAAIALSLFPTGAMNRGMFVPPAQGYFFDPLQFSVWYSL